MRRARDTQQASNNRLRARHALDRHGKGYIAVPSSDMQERLSAIVASLLTGLVPNGQDPESSQQPRWLDRSEPSMQGVVEVGQVNAGGSQRAGMAAAWKEMADHTKSINSGMEAALLLCPFHNQLPNLLRFLQHTQQAFVPSPPVCRRPLQPFTFACATSLASCLPHQPSRQPPTSPFGVGCVYLHARKAILFHPANGEPQHRIDFSREPAYSSADHTTFRG